MKRFFLLFARFLLFALLLSGAGCGTRSEKIHRNVTFTHVAGRALKLDLYVPTQVVAPPPLVIWFHGGGWRFGDKRFAFHLRKLTQDGFAVATVQYRLTWSAKWPAQGDDAITAVRWLSEAGQQYGYDGSRIALAGESAGGHLAALVGLVERSPQIKAVVVLYPVTDLVALGKRYAGTQPNLLELLLGGPYSETKEIAYEASPINYVSRSAPPFLLLHGDADLVVPLDQSKRLNRALAQAGVQSKMLVFPGNQHGFAPDRKARAEISEYLHSKLDEKPSSPDSRSSARCSP